MCRLYLPNIYTRLGQFKGYDVGGSSGQFCHIFEIIYYCFVVDLGHDVDAICHLP